MLRAVQSGKSASARALRGLTLTFALFAVSGQILGGLHFALVHHVTCAEHGELIEVGASLDHPEARNAVSSIAAQEAGGHGHDHCAIALLRRQRVFRPALLTAPLRAAPALRSLLARASLPALTPIDILSIAPKSSPPA